MVRPVKPAPFGYIRVATAEQAVGALVEHADVDARVISGGQSLLPMMGLRLSVPGVLVDVSRVESLRGWSLAHDHVRIGAAVRAREIELATEFGDALPLLTATVGWVSHPEIRNRGTIGGSIAHADPAAELPALLLAMDGAVEVLGPQGARTISAERLLIGPYATSLEEGELITAIRLPVLGPWTGWAIEEVARRNGDFALVGVIVLVDLDGRSVCTNPRIVLFGVGGQAVRARAAEAALEGQLLTSELLETAAALVTSDVEVSGDIHGSADYRERVAVTLLDRALRSAVERLGHRLPHQEIVS